MQHGASQRAWDKELETTWLFLPLAVRKCPLLACDFKLALCCGRAQLYRCYRSPQVVIELWYLLPLRGVPHVCGPHAHVVYISLTAFMALLRRDRSVWRQPEFRAVKAFERDYHNYKRSTFSAFSAPPSLPAQPFPSRAYHGAGCREAARRKWL